MKPLPAPNVPGDTEFERFDNAVRQILTVSKQDVLRREAEEKQADKPFDSLIPLEQAEAIMEKYLENLKENAQAFVDSQEKGKP
jgi:ribosomal protein L22